MKRHLVALIVMISGSATVFGAAVVMNLDKTPPAREVSGTTTSFEVAPKPPPKKKTEKRTPPKNRKTSSKNPPPPMPNLAASLGSVSLGLPGVDVGAVNSNAGALLGEVRASVMTEDSVDSQPKVRRRASAAYPARARAQGITGQVTLNVLISEDGRVERVKVLEATPKGVFDQTAIEAIQRWEFEPATYQGEAVKVWARQTIRFDLT